MKMLTWLALLNMVSVGVNIALAVVTGNWLNWFIALFCLGAGLACLSITDIRRWR